MNEELAVPRPVMPVSDVEQNALKELMPKLSTEGCELQAKRIKEATLTGPTSEPTPVPEFIRRRVQADRARIEVEIEILQRGKA